MHSYLLKVLKKYNYSNLGNILLSLINLPLQIVPLLFSPDERYHLLNSPEGCLAKENIQKMDKCLQIRSISPFTGQFERKPQVTML